MKKKKTTPIEDSIYSLAGEIDWHEGDSSETRSICKNIRILSESQKILEESKRTKIDPNVVAKAGIEAGGAIIGAAILSNAERMRIIPQKAFNVVLKMFKN